MPRTSHVTGPVRRSLFRFVAAGATLGLAAAGLSIVPAESASADGSPCSSGHSVYSAAIGSYTVPAGVFNVNIVASGGKGEGGHDYTFVGPDGGDGGYGSTITVKNEGVTPGETIYWGNLRPGNTDREARPASSGSGGAGMWVSTVACITDDSSTVIVVAAGGGGGGDADEDGRGGNGGNADSPGGAGGRGGPGGENGAYAGAGGTAGTLVAPGFGGASGHGVSTVSNFQDPPGGDGAWMFGPFYMGTPFDWMNPPVGGNGANNGVGGGGGGSGYSGGGGGGDSGMSPWTDHGGGAGGGAGGASFPLSLATINYSGTAGVTVAPHYTPRVTLTSSANPQPFGSSVTLTATVTSQNPAAKLGGGTVSFSDQTSGTQSDSVPLGDVPLTLDSTGLIATALITVPDLAAGPRKIVASYNGFGGYAPDDPGHLHYIETFPAFTDLTQRMLLPQTLTFTAPSGAGTANGATTRPAATSTSGLPVSIRVDLESTGVCSRSDDGVLSYLTGGTCVLDANQVGDDLHEAAPQVQLRIPVAGAKSQTIRFTTTQPATMNAGDTYTPHATGGDSGNPVVITSDGTHCPMVDGTVVARLGGQCGITATQAAGNGYLAATQIWQTTEINPAPGHMLFQTTPPDSPQIGDHYTVIGQALYPSIGAGDAALTVDAASTACTMGMPSVTLAGGMVAQQAVVTYTAVGTCIIDANAVPMIYYPPPALAPLAQVQQVSTVAGAAQHITFTSPDPTDPMYGGSTTVAATSSSGLPVTFTSATPSTCSVGGALVAFVGAGECEIHADQGGDATTWAAAPTVTKTLTIDAVPLTITAPTGSAPYGAVPTAFAPTYGGFVAGDGLASLRVQPLCTRPSTSADAGSYPVTCSGAVDSDYTFVYVAGAETITPAPLTVTASGGTTGYGLAVPTVTASYSGFTNGDTALDTAPSCGTEATDHSDIGDYASSCVGGADPNYTITSVDGKVSITEATLVVIASSENRNYGDAAPAITASYLGLQGGDTAPATPPTCTSSVGAQTHPGDYASTCSGASDANYTIVYSDGAVHVMPAALTVIAPRPSTQYGTSVAVEPQYKGLVGGDAAPETRATCLTDATSSSPVGTYPVDCSGASDPDYTIAYRSGSVSVAPSPLTVTASSASTVWGSAVPAVVPSYSGLVLGETAPAHPAVCSTAATPNSPAGSYPTTCSGAVDPNYAIDYVDGTVALTAPVVTAPVVTAPDPTAAPPAGSSSAHPFTGSDIAPSGSAGSRGSAGAIGSTAAPSPSTAARAPATAQPSPSAGASSGSHTDSTSSTDATRTETQGPGVLAFWPAWLAVLLAGIAVALALVLRRRARP